MYFELTDHFLVAADLGRTWGFFSAAENLPRITPPAMGFTIDTPRPAGGGAMEMRNDVLLDYTIRWMGLPVKWRTRIVDWSPPHQFIDLQLRGPYTLWHHQHRFIARGATTECSDRVIYKLPGGPIGTIVHAMIVRRQLQEIFRFRRGAIGQFLGAIQPLQDDVLVRRI